MKTRTYQDNLQELIFGKVYQETLRLKKSVRYTYTVDLTDYDSLLQQLREGKLQNSDFPKYQTIIKVYGKTRTFIISYSVQDNKTLVFYANQYGLPITYKPVLELTGKIDSALIKEYLSHNPKIADRKNNHFNQLSTN